MDRKRRGSPFDGPSKRVRFSEVAASGTSASEDDVEFDHEAMLEPARKRKGAVQTDGYGSEASSSDEDDVARRRQKKDKAQEQEEDMFALDEPAEPEPDPKKPRNLRLEEIEGQEDLPNDSLQLDKEETKIEPFNMKQEMEEGSFDETGNYIRNKKDEQAFHDNWLQDISKEEIEAARIAQEKQDRANKLKEAQETAVPLSKIDLYKGILALMEPGETVLEALQRLNAAQKSGTKKLSWKERQKRAKEAKKGMAVDEVTTADPAEEARKMAIETLTDLSDKMMGLGQFDIYDDTYEYIVRYLDRERNHSASASPLPTTTTTTTTATTTNGTKQWHYRWRSDPPSEELFGPFSSDQMQSWRDSGYFAGGVEVRTADGTEFVPIEEVTL
ncbi:hypothetical protein BZG36_02998 [Bifiguratus adelaidae]|uniref:GYF domain-containing protein n=1 Tax=Bifiguratus adelaidae TaxID=1938954 RepID=A0A261XYA6_9FUNG|nr:hypothetical protein BZG36_02998 [Bifiguratus adelaidae]